MTSTMELVTESVPDLTKPKTFKTMTNSERISYIKEVITVEPLMGAYVFAAVLCGPALSNLELEKACRVDAGYNDTICEAILTGQHENFTQENNNVQVIISDMHSWQSPIQNIVPILMILFLGSYSDRHKLRKPFLLLPIFGELFAVAGCILSVIFLRQWPIWIMGVMQTVVPSFFGGQPMFMMAIFSYIADVSSLEMRTLRIGIVQIVLNVCFPVVQSFSGILYTQIGYYGILLFAGGVYLAGFIYGLICVKETKESVEETGKSCFMDILDPRHVIDTFKIAYKKVPGFSRVNILLLMAITFFAIGISNGEVSILFLYTQKIYSWTIVEFSYYTTINTLIHLIGTVIGLPLFTKVLKWTDYSMIIASFLDKIVSNMIIALGETSVFLYISCVVSLITSLSVVGMRSLASKVVSQDDLGKAQSLFGVCEALGPALFTPIFNSGIYTQTIDTFPAAFILVGAALFGICTLLTIVMFFRNRTDGHKKVNVDNDKNGMQMNASDVQNGTKKQEGIEISTHM